MRSFRVVGFIIALLALGPVPFAAAQDSSSETIILDINIFGDTATPTTPTILSVVPVAFNQIDVTWSTSTDNVEVGGYQIFRDGTAIATSTQQSYSDTGLMGSTTYTYSVRAFDISRQYSFLSATSATTTPSPPPPPPVVPSDGDPSRSGVQLLELNIETDLRSAMLKWRTDIYSRYSIRWGRTANYELGFVTNDVFAKNHASRITELEPNTVYEFEIIGYSEAGSPYTLIQDNFTTKAAPDTVPPPNVSNLTAVELGGGVSLSWQNPTVDDFSRIRVLRSYLYFPTDPYDGFVVYQGDGEAVMDPGAFTFGPDAFYTVFAYDERGNVSSGAVVYVQQGRGMVPINEISPDRWSQRDGDEGDNQPDGSGTGDDKAFILEFKDIEVVQNDVVLRPNSVGEIDIDGSLPTTVRIDYELLPEHLKTITVTFTHPDDDNQIFSFLLRVNQRKTAYEATVMPFMRSGVYNMSVSVVDFKTNVVTTVVGELTASYQPPVRSVFAEGINWLRVLLILAGVMLLLLVVLLAWVFRQREGH